jgi:hypothetical protein
MIDKTDPAAIAAAQQMGIPINDCGELVGETDNSAGFGIGPASSEYKLAASNVIAAKKKEAKKPKKEKQG